MISSEIKLYELSLWEDGPDGVERKICNISSHTMNSAAKAYNINLTRKVNGERQLVFTICAKYYDEIEGELTLNPYLKLLTNERKVKLWQEKNGEKQWYDFVIKNISEDSSNSTYTYTAKDQHVQELSKNGFNIEFDKELKNNTKTANEFAVEILKGTNWDVKESAPIIEYMEEPLYMIQISENIEVIDILSGSSDEIEAPAAIYIPYSVKNGEDEYFQFLYSHKYNTIGEDLPKDDDGVLLKEYFRNYHCFEKIDVSNATLALGYRGGKIVRSVKTVYDSKLERYVNIYHQFDNEGNIVEEELEDGTIAPKEYYGFTETEYRAPDFVQSIITNGYEFSSITGWGSVLENGVASEKEMVVYPLVKNWTANTSSISTYIATTGQIFNHGFFDARTGLNGIVKGQEYIFRVWAYQYDFDNKNIGGLITQGQSNSVNVSICDYDIDGAHYIKKNNGKSYFSNPVYYSSAPYLQITLTATETLSKEELSKSKIGIFLDFGEAAAIKEAWLFPKKLDENGKIIYPDKRVSSVAPEPEKLVRTRYRFFDSKQDYNKIDDIKFLYDDYTENENFELQYHTYPEKRRTITAKESNRFNLLQEVCEVFEVWLRIEIEHDDQTGQILSKSVSFQPYIGKEKYNGFKYGINLNSIKRTIDSDKIVTKLIVKNNSNEFAKNGFCSIARAPSNPGGTNVIYNFDYYINQGLLDAEETEKALYDSNQGLYPKLLDNAKRLRSISDQIVGVSKNIVQTKAIVDYEDARLSAAEDLSMETREDLKELTKFTYEELCGTNVINDSFINWKNSERIIPYMTKIFTANKTINEATINYSNASAVLAQQEENLRLLNEEQSNLIKSQERLEQEFFKRYSRFIQEGSWISEDYVDDDLYYLDSLSTLYTSAKPQISYTINVFDLAHIEDFENYNFDIGDKTFVEDTEFFGWVYDKNGIKSPYREEVIVSEITEGIDDPSKNNLKIQNYKTQFDDLFQRIAAATEQLQYNTGRYERFGNAVEQDGSISYTALQQTVNENGLAIANAGAQTVSCDERGIITIDKTTPAKQVRIIGGGIYMTTDGGETWKTGLTGEGINANVITTGQLNAGEVNIMTDSAPTHKWDNMGITAYKTSYNISNGLINSVDNSTFVRFDEFGFYGIENIPDFNARVADGASYGVKKIKANSVFSFTWDGVTIGKPGIGLEATSEKLTIGGDDGLIATSEGLMIGGDNGFKATEDGFEIGNQNNLGLVGTGDSLIIGGSDNGVVITKNGFTIGGSSGLESTTGGLTIGGSDGVNISGSTITIGGSGGLTITSGSLSIGENFKYIDKQLTIAGWKIDKNLIKSEQQTSIIALKSNDDPFKIGDLPELNWKIYAGVKNNGTTTYNFGVSASGVLYASQAHIEGTIKATSGEFSKDVTIGGTSVTAAMLRDLYNYATKKNTNGGETETIIQQVNVTGGGSTLGGWKTVKIRVPDANPVISYYGDALSSDSISIGSSGFQVYLTPKGCYYRQTGSEAAIWFGAWKDIVGTTHSVNSISEE